VTPRVSCATTATTTTRTWRGCTRYSLVDRICRSPQAADDVVDTAKIVARLYAWQLEEVDAA
jgi:hypothetical protein